MKIILCTLFNFDMFSTTAWIRLAHSRLYGFGGMVFGILILAALPMYAATTAIIVRTKKPLFKLWIPQFILRSFTPPAPPTEQKTDEPEKKAEPETQPEKFPDDMPTELRGAFIRARRGGLRPASAFDNSNIINRLTPQPVMAVTDTVATNNAEDFPIPLNFDISDDFTPAPNALPSFTEITFDNAPDTKPAATPQTPPIEGAKPDGEFIIYKDNIIATHDDPDFWIADEIDWFATGKQRPSPIQPLKQRATELNLNPVLYLAETNILDLENRIAEWEKDGITIIKNLTELA
ncbi:MAG: hypothetical protein K2I81_00165 [Alphaproteobacteria bacterium]|nr:hypothetical protein [Alphaproteobacteria bacterium]